VYYSATGNVHALARAVAEGATAEGADVRLRHVAELGPEMAISFSQRWGRHRSELEDQPEASLEDLEMIDRTRAARDLLASKWKVDLLYLLARGVHRYSRLYDNLKGASKKMLTDSLRGLERDGFVERMVFPEVPVRVEYSLTQLGWSVTQLLIDLADWAGEHFPDVEDARRRYDQAKSETDAVAPPGWPGLNAAA
jgi:DNA-binding HxlR family transcriptional regulator